MRSGYPRAPEAKLEGSVIYKTLFGTALVIAGITLAIVYLSIDHKKRIGVSLAATVHAGDKAPSKKDNSLIISPMPYTDGKQALVSGGPCNIERMDGELLGAVAHQARPTDIEISGWLVDQATKSIPQNASIRVENNDRSHVWIVPITPIIDRADVQASEGGEPAYRRSGFLVKFDLSGLPSGGYRVLLQYQIAGHGYTCDNGRSLQIGS